jgi:hypothetical protein
MLDTDKVSLVLAAEYVGLSPGALEAMEVTGWIKAISHAGRIPVYLGADIKRLKAAAPPETPEQKLQKRIRQSREEAQAKIMECTNDLLAIQGGCTHPNATKTAKSDTGNWDRSQDAYWNDCACPDCGKSWSEDQKK